MLLSDVPPVIDPAAAVLEVGLRPETPHAPPAGSPPGAWAQLYRLPADGLPSPGGDAAHYFGRNPADPGRNAFVVVYDAAGVWRYLLVRPSPEHPWAVAPVPDPAAAARPGVLAVFDDPLHAAAAADLLRRLAEPAGLSEADCWNLVRALRQAREVAAVGAARAAA